MKFGSIVCQLQCDHCFEQNHFQRAKHEDHHESQRIQRSRSIGLRKHNRAIDVTAADQSSLHTPHRRSICRARQTGTMGNYSQTIKALPGLQVTTIDWSRKTIELHWLSIVESGPPPHHSGGPFEVVNLFRLSVSTFNYDTLSVGVHQLSPNASPIDRWWSVVGGVEWREKSQWTPINLFDDFKRVVYEFCIRFNAK